MIWETISLWYFPVLLLLLLAIWWTPALAWRKNEKLRRTLGKFLFIVNLPFYYFMVAPAFYTQPYIAGTPGTILFWTGVVVLSYGILLSLLTVPFKIKAGGPGYDPHQLIQEGVFGYVRHPQMAGALAISLGCACWQGAIYHLYLNIFYFFILYGQIWMEEKFLLLPLFGDEYRHYREKVKTLIPYIF